MRLNRDESRSADRLIVAALATPTIASPFWAKIWCDARRAVLPPPVDRAPPVRPNKTSPGTPASKWSASSFDAPKIAPHMNRRMPKREFGQYLSYGLLQANRGGEMNASDAPASGCRSSAAVRSAADSTSEDRTCS